MVLERFFHPIKMQRIAARNFDAESVPMPILEQITRYLDRYLKIKGVNDWPNALNGLQVENSGAVKKIGAAVDACEHSIREAAARGVSLLLVHHGLFWGGVQPLAGAHFRKMKAALDADLAIYSAHLPLDMHPQVGNNALLCKALGFKKTASFFFEKNQFIGLKTRTPMTRDELVRRCEKALGDPVRVCAGGPARVSRIGVVTGGAGAEVGRAAAEGVDTFITGEGPHHSYLLAEELGVNLIYGGHYATERFGVKALAEHVARRFGVTWEFIDHPTGL
jgi:dinuclear metal center YbgI/SA1388 family protein